MVGLLFFLVGAIIAAVANGFSVLLVGRSLQGIGGGGLIALTEIVVTDLVPLRLRGRWFGIISGMWSLGSVSGPIIGGAFAQNVSWVSSPNHDSYFTTYLPPSDGYSTSTSPLSVLPLSSSHFS